MTVCLYDISLIRLLHHHNQSIPPVKLISGLRAIIVIINNKMRRQQDKQLRSLPKMHMHAGPLHERLY